VTGPIIAQRLNHEIALANQLAEDITMFNLMSSLYLSSGVIALAIPRPALVQEPTGGAR
jgi:hypothetical protein